MDSTTPTEETDPPAILGDQLFFELADDHWGPWLLHRLAQGDVVTLCVDGTWLVTSDSSA
jgi:hypothetical protein